MPKKRSKNSGKLLSLIKWTMTAVVWIMTFGIGLVAWYASDLPDINDALKATRQPTVTLLAVDGSLLTTRGDLYGQPLGVKDVPVVLSQAVLATEDRRFYKHFGLDLIGIARATYSNLKAGRIVQGGSTITQQLAKNLFLTPERSFKRKAQELILSLWLEHRFSKEQILTIYLNRAYLGAGTHGVDAAARRYFGVSAKRVNIFEAAMIAGLLKAPSRYNPWANLELAKKRAGQVLVNMVDAGYLSKGEARRAIKHAYVRRIPKSLTAGYFVDWALNQVSGYLTPGDRDIVVTTTLDPAIQQAAERRLVEVLDGPGEKARASQAALVALAEHGAVRAMVGGRLYSKSPFNRATQARRQPGSAFKPFVFLAALEMGMRTNQTFKDAPIKIGKWTPRNFNRRYLGDVTMAEAFSHSLNTAAVRIGQRVGLTNIAETANRLGIPGNIQLTPSLSLGTHDVSLINLTAAYAPFANGGIAVWPYGILEIRDDNNKVLYSREGSGLGRVVRHDHVVAMNQMMEDVIANGTGKAAYLDWPAAGKTGTSQNHRDAWFVGYTANLVTGVWIGNDNGTPMMRVTGGGLPAILWKRFMIDAHQGLTRHALPSFELPEGSDRFNATFPSVFEPGENIKKSFIENLFSLFQTD